MKNIHVLPTDKPSRLSKNKEGLHIFEKGISYKAVNIYITSDEEIIGEKEWFLDLRYNFIFKNQIIEPMNKVIFPNCKKIILTTDQDLITDGVQAIDDEFLEWFVKNPSCEYVKVEDYGNLYNFRYLILIPKEESKQETLEEARVNSYIDFAKSNEDVSAYSFIAGWDKGAKWQQERMYSDEEVKQAYTEGGFAQLRYINGLPYIDRDKWFEQFKNK